MQPRNPAERTRLLKIMSEHELADYDRLLGKPYFTDPSGPSPYTVEEERRLADYAERVRRT
jgi:hypothetical protein